MVPTSHLTLDNEDPSEGHVPNYKFILLHYNTPLVLTCPDIQYLIKFASILGIWEKMPNPTYRRGADGKAQMHKVWI